MVRIPGFHPGGPGSTHGMGIYNALIQKWLVLCVAAVATPGQILVKATNRKLKWKKELRDTKDFKADWVLGVWMKGPSVQLLPTTVTHSTFT